MSETGGFPAIPPEIDLAKQQDRHQFELAMRTLEVRQKTTEQDRTVWAAAQKRQSWLGAVMAALFLLLFFGFGAYALHLGKEAFLADILKVVTGALGGGGIGYVYGRQKAQKTEGQ